MFYADSITAAANYLKQAIPKMVAINSPANPINYTLWYNYVAKRIPALNQSIDSILESRKGLTEAQSRELYQRHILVDYVGEQTDRSEELTELASHLLAHLGQVTKGSDELDQVIKENVSKIQGADTLLDIKQLVSVVVASANAISEKNAQFKQDLTRAAEEIEVLQKELDEANSFASLDSLTQLYNRRAFDRELKHLLDNQKPHENICLVLIDLDHFKSFNDNYGHTIGDLVLQKTAWLIQESCPEFGMGARYGGEEFALILNKTSLIQAVKIAETLCQRLRRLRVKVRSSQEYLENITASFGVAQYVTGETLETFIDRADKALYAAKDGGRNCVKLAS